MEQLIERINQASKVKLIRSYLHWTQKQMVEYLNGIGKTNQPNYSKMESGQIPFNWRYEVILKLFRKERQKLILEIEIDIIAKKREIENIKSL